MTAPLDDPPPRRPGRKAGTAGPNSDAVARLAGVSRSTVSRAFTPGASIAPVTLERVMTAARELSYSPNPLARSLISRRTDTVGLVMGHPDNPFYQAVLTGFTSRLQQRDLRVMCQTAPDTEGVEDSVRSMLRYNIDAVIVTSSGITSAAVQEAHAVGVPVILFNRTVHHDALSWVQTDNHLGGRAVADLLNHGGHRRVAYINGLENASTNRDRLAGFAERLAELDLPPPLLEYGEYSYDGGREAVKRLMLGGEPPDAVFCANDISAFGALDGLRHDLGLRVPQDVSLVGFDDVPMAAWPCFDLTTVRQRRNRMIDATLELLDLLMRDPDRAPLRRDIPGQLIVRRSARLGQPGAAG